MQKGAVPRVQGFHDHFGGRYQHLRRMVDSLTTSFDRHGFALMEVPLVEGLDLYLRKNGAQVLSRLYSFIDPDRGEVALRPEYTASVIRALASAREITDQPWRVSYAGPVFRNAPGQEGESRQFTQAGIEILGDSSVVADAEVLALACRAVRDAGLPRVRLVVGHLGPLRTLLAHLKVNGQAEGYLLEHLEHRYRGGTGDETVRRRLGLQSHEGEGLLDSEALPEHLAEAVRGATPEEARVLVLTMLDQMGLSIEGTTRTPDEIIDRVLLKARRHAALRGGRGREDLERALDFTEQLSTLRGNPDEIMPRAEALMAHYQVPPEALDELREVLDLLRLYELDGVTIELAPGMARGIAYYSGLIFELYGDQSALGQPGAQICGGGRYDMLASAITGGHGFPALGFSFNVEALAAVVPPNPSPSDGRIGLIVHEPGQRRVAYRMANHLRARGFPVTTHEPGNSSVQERHLRDNGYAAVVILPLPQAARARTEILVFESREDHARLEEVLAIAIEECGFPVECPDLIVAGEVGQ